MGQAWSKFSVDVASGITLSSSLDLGRSYKDVYLEIPTMASGSDFYIQCSHDNSTFRRVQMIGEQFMRTANTMTTNTTQTAAFDLGHGAKNAYLYVGTMATGTSIQIRASADGSTFQRVLPMVIATSAAQAIADFSYATFAADVSRVFPIPQGIRHFKVEFQTAVSNNQTVVECFYTNPYGQSDFKIASANTNRIVPVPGNFRYYKVELSTAMTDATTTFRLLCGGD